MYVYFGLKCNDAVCHRNNKKTETAESAAAFVGTCDITNVSLEQVHLNAYCDGRFGYVICSFYWYLWDNNTFCLVTR
jgi:hypothetical protein